jgi:hypothetical protein
MYQNIKTPPTQKSENRPTDFSQHFSWFFLGGLAFLVLMKFLGFGLVFGLLERKFVFQSYAESELFVRHKDTRISKIDPNLKNFVYGNYAKKQFYKKICQPKSSLSQSVINLTQIQIKAEKVNSCLLKSL